MEREIIKEGIDFERTRFSIQEGEFLKVHDNKAHTTHLFYRGIVEVETKGVSVRDIILYIVVGNDLKKIAYMTVSNDLTIEEGRLENV